MLVEAAAGHPPDPKGVRMVRLVVVRSDAALVLVVANVQQVVDGQNAKPVAGPAELEDGEAVVSLRDLLPQRRLGRFQTCLEKGGVGIVPIVRAEREPAVKLEHRSLPWRFNGPGGATPAGTRPSVGEGL